MSDSARYCLQTRPVGGNPPLAHLSVAQRYATASRFETDAHPSTLAIRQVVARYMLGPSRVSLCDMSTRPPPLEHSVSSTTSAASGIGPMTIEELETGLSRLKQCQAGDLTFWDENVATFRRTVLFALRETSAMLASSSMSSESWIELERQRGRLRQYLKLADNYLRTRRLN